MQIKYLFASRNIIEAMSPVFLKLLFVNHAHFKMSMMNRKIIVHQFLKITFQESISMSSSSAVQFDKLLHKNDIKNAKTYK